jgi:hypothetical protein
MSHSANQRELESRVIQAAEIALFHQHYVSAIDVLCGMRLLHTAQIHLWRKGRVDFLERVIQGNFSKISSSMAIVRGWARENGLKPSETAYVRKTRSGTVPLQFSKIGDPETEKSYRTHYVSPLLSERKQQSLQEKLNRAPELVVYEILGTAQCSECGAEMEQGSLFFKEGDTPLCMACAGLGDLEFLAAGDVALTRRAARYSARAVIVVRFSRTRKRYERRGILAESAALDRAEQECVEDAGERAAARARNAARRHEEDRELKLRMAEKIGILFPGCPPQELAAIAEHTATRGSGRVGRSKAGRDLKEEALTAAVVAAIRHCHTGYDELLARGIDRATARQEVAGAIDEILDRWRTTQRSRTA